MIRTCQDNWTDFRDMYRTDLTRNDLMRVTRIFGLWGHITVMSHERRGVSNHRRIECLFNSLFRLVTKKNQSPRYWPFVSGIHRWQRASNAEYISMSWRHHDKPFVKWVPMRMCCALQWRRMSVKPSQITDNSTIYQQLVEAHNKVHTKAQHYWLFVNRSHKCQCRWEIRVFVVFHRSKGYICTSCCKPLLAGQDWKQWYACILQHSHLGIWLYFLVCTGKKYKHLGNDGQGL